MSNDLKIHKAILRRIGAIHVYDVIEEMGYDIDEMSHEFYEVVKDQVEKELTFVHTLLKRTKP